MNKKDIISKEINFEGKPLRLETGELATMTNLTVKATWGDTVLLVTVVTSDYNPEIDYFPLNVNYVEKMFATGSIKSSRFVKRDGRATDDARIAGRAIDHSIRPLFPNDFSDETQIVVTVLSVDPDADAEFLAMLTVSATLTASDIPWNGPMAPARVGYIKGEYKLCPTRHSLEEESDLDLIVTFVGEDKRFLGLEAEANILPEEKILGAVEFGRTNSEQLFDLINGFAKAVNPKGTKYEYTSTNPAEDLVAAVSKIATPKIEEAIPNDFRNNNCIFSFK